MTAMFVPTSQLVVADRYELIDEIGRGSMGVIWRARQTNLGIECAIKFIHAGQAHDPELRRRFVREARAAASLKSPHSVHILDVDEWQGCLFIAMELLIGETLEARLERVGKLSPEDTLEIVDQVARGLNKAHAARLVHRDLKPDNIFLVDDEPLLVKILDFGIAKRLDNIAGLQTASGALLGTPGYMSPEQALASKTIDYRSDLWSLAVVVFRCLTGVEPFDGDGIGQILVEIVKGPLKKPSAINPHLPPSLDDWWLRATQREPEARHESATELVNDLKRALDSQPLWPESAFEPTVAGNSEPSLEAAPATLEPVLAAQRNSSPAAMRYSVAMVPALIASGWFIGRALWSPSPGEWRTGRADPSASVSFAVEPVTAAPLPPVAPAGVSPALAGAAGQPAESAASAAGAGGAGGNAATPASSAESSGVASGGSMPMPSKDVPSPAEAPANAEAPAKAESSTQAAPPARSSREPGASERDEPRSPVSTPKERRDDARRSGAGGAASKSTGRRSGSRDPAATPPEADAEQDRAALDAAPPGDALRPSREDDPDLRY